MPSFICSACGTSYPPSEKPPANCPICEEERQLVPEAGQSWTTPQGLAARHLNAFREYEPGIIGIGSRPQFGIGQRALLVCTPHGNVLWDCISLLDAATITLIKGLGGLKAIAISHPHFYSSMGDWSRAFGDIPIYLHGADRKWIMRPEPSIIFWEGDAQEVLPGVTLVRTGGHFPGASVLHWAGGANGRGVLLTADTTTITLDRKYFTFMRAYPNFIPLSAREVEAIGTALAPYPFDAAYGHFFDRVIPAQAKEIFEMSIQRYLAAIAGTARPDGE
ncbi:MBL fold metallo-hydrolase [Boseaceae bacterium BT-24-1]|nr:MBL fold metallo-hydrolase [Boseaceae bacterium BT-24-1]